MPFVLVIAFAASLGLHGLVLFGPDVDLSMAAEPPPLVVEVKPPPAPLPLESPPKLEAKPLAGKRRPPARRSSPSPRPAPEETAVASAEAEPIVHAVAESLAEPEQEGVDAGDSGMVPLAVPAPLVAKGAIEYRVDRGDQGFQIGRSVHQWEVVEGTYRIVATTETSGLVGLFRPLRIELESSGRMTAAGLRPERFTVRQKGRENEEQTDFDWEEMLLRMRNRPPQTLAPGAQDLLSFNYQLGLMGKLTTGSSLPIATGKKLATYYLEVVGDEEIETPAGTFRCLHLRVPGVATTELWLAYDRFLLPVRVQHIDRRGDLYVQLATAIALAEEP